MTFIMAPDVGTYSTRTQYLTAAEFMAAPTGVSVSDIVPGGSAAAQVQALEMQIQRASAMVDNYCQQPIAATVNTQSGMWRVQPSPGGCGACIRVELDNSPILGVTSITTGTRPSTMALMTDYTDVWVGKKTVTVPVYGYGGALFATVEYVSGYANTALTAPAAVGDTTLTVASPLGIMPGQRLNIQGVTDGENVTIDPTWTPQTAGIAITVPTTTPLVNAYLVDDTVTAFPQDIKQAVILLTKTLILVPGDEAIVIPTYSSQPTQTQNMVPSVTTDLARVARLLKSYSRAH